MTLKIQAHFEMKTTASFDSGADQNCIKKELIPSQYYERTTEQLLSVN